MSNEDGCSCCQMRNKIKELEKRVKKLEELLQINKTDNNNNHNIKANVDEEISRETKVELSQINHESIDQVISITRRVSPFDRSIVIGDQRRKDGGRPKSYPYSIGDENVIGIKEDVKKLVKAINSKNNKFFAIVGMGGSGKTTLARKIFNHKEIERQNVCKAWVCVSQTWDEHYLLREIHRQIIGRKDEELSIEAIVDELHKFVRDRSCLVVLDDVWQKKVLIKIMVPIASSPGVKFLITTRNRKVVKFSNLKVYIHTPTRLTEEEMLELFRKIAFCKNATFVDLAKKMLKKCDGLPLAVIVLAGLLGQKETIHEWRKVENNVSSKINEDEKGPPDYGMVKDVIGLSFSELDLTTKSCFMYLGLFPEDAEISTGMLMRCWIAEGFFKFIWLEENETVEDVAGKYLDELIQRCLVQVATSNYFKIVRTIRVHDLLRNLAIKKARRKFFFDTINSNSVTSRHPSTAALMTMQNLRLGDSNSGEVSQIENVVKGSPKIRSFVRLTNSYSMMQVNSCLFTNYPLLRVLILHDVDFKLDIPDEIGNLKHLRCFRLMPRFAFDLPDSMEKLRYLLILDYRINGQLFGNNPVNVPNLKEMKQLTYLRLPRQKLPDDNYELNLHELKYLKALMGIGAGKWMMRELKFISPSVEKLEIVDIKDSEQLEMVYECPNIVRDYLYTLKLEWWQSPNRLQLALNKLQHCKRLQKLHLNGEFEKGVPLIFPPNLIELRLESTGITDRHSFAEALARLVCLKILFLADCSYEDSHLTFPSSSLLELEHLHIRWCEKLEEIQVEEGAIPNLRYIYISECDRLLLVPECLSRLPSKFMSWKTLPPINDD